METSIFIRKTDLARQTRRLTRDAQSGLIIVVENRGQPELAIIDYLDYRILRATLRFYVDPVEVDSRTVLVDELLANWGLTEKVEIIMTYYLAEAITLGRAAEMLGIPMLDLRTRFLRLDVPLRESPAEAAEAAEASTEPELVVISMINDQE